MECFDKKIKGSISLEKIHFNRILCRKVINSNKNGSKVSIPKNLELEGKYVYILIPLGEKKK